MLASTAATELKSARCGGECQINTDTDQSWRTMKTRPRRAMMNHGYNGASLITDDSYDVAVPDDVCSWHYSN